MVKNKKNIPTDIEQAAYHESGHLIMTYFLRFKVEKIQILLNDNKTVKLARTRYLYDKSTILATGIENINQLVNSFSNLTPQMKESYINFAKKRILILCGGPIAETLLLIGDNKPTSINTEFRGPDLPKLENIDKFLSIYDTQYDNNILKKNMKTVTIFFSQDIFWNSISCIALELLASNNLCINQGKIEKILTKTGFIQYIDKQWD